MRLKSLLYKGQEFVSRGNKRRANSEAPRLPRQIYIWFLLLPISIDTQKLTVDFSMRCQTKLFFHHYQECAVPHPKFTTAWNAFNEINIAGGDGRQETWRQS